jgi:putative transposase
MPFEESSPIDQRFKFISAWKEDDRAFAELCRAFGISRPTGYKWINRYRSEGVGGMADRSHAARRHPNELMAHAEELILQARDRHPTWGPKKLVAWIKRRDGIEHLCAPSTAGEILRRHGMSQPRVRRRYTELWPEVLGSYEGVNAVWCIDFKGWFKLGNGQRCDALTITDGCSRFLLRCAALERITLVNTRRILEAAFREYGLPERIRSDNGAPFGSVAIGGLSALAVWLMKLGIVPERIEPAQPYQNGRHERMHLTLNEAVIPPGYDLRAQQRKFDAFRKCFNEERPHEALGQQTPANHYAPSPRPFAGALQEPQYEEHVETRRIQNKGEFSWGGRNVFLSESLRGELIGIKAIGKKQWEVRFASKVLGTFDEKTMKMKPKDKRPRKRRKKCLAPK